jgi:sugar lactone lactonase YvrE
MHRFVILCLGALLVAPFAVTSKEVGAQAGGSVITLDPAFQRIAPAGATIEKLAGPFRFLEGPIWDPAGFLLFSDYEANEIKKWTPDGKVTTFRKPSGNSAGLTLDRQGRLIACEIGNRRVSRTEKDGTVVTLADRYNGKRLHGSNDVVVRSDGSIYFTDESLDTGIEVQELPFSGVFCLSPDGKLALLADDFEAPNGLAFSPDEKTLYIVDSNRNYIRAFDVSADGTLANGRVFATVRSASTYPDGMKLDSEGNLYCCTGSGGVEVFDPSGKRLGMIKVPAPGVTNVGWGDADRKGLYITALTGLYRIRLNIPGNR